MDFTQPYREHSPVFRYPLREILFVLRQKYTWTSPRFFLDFPGLFPVFSGVEKLLFYDFFYDENIDFLR